MEKKFFSLNNLAILVVLQLLFGFKVHVNNKGFITGMKNTTITTNREFSPTDKASPLVCLYDSKNKNIASRK